MLELSPNLQFRFRIFARVYYPPWAYGVLRHVLLLTRVIDGNGVDKEVGHTVGKVVGMRVGMDTFVGWRGKKLRTLMVSVFSIMMKSVQNGIMG